MTQFQLINMQKKMLLYQKYNNLIFAEKKRINFIFQKGVDVVYETIGGDMFDTCVEK